MRRWITIANLKMFLLYYICTAFNANGLGATDSEATNPRLTSMKDRIIRAYDDRSLFGESIQNIISNTLRYEKEGKKHRVK
ncbi:MAG: hypothetical protein LBQ03_00525 [Puniceicoccales bacterium]|jgi:hypothetical protein|nr:hypothetical protein [Puniceicoccales bacterium]